jgi:hypothetical protein
MQGAVAACIKDWKVDTLQELVAKAYTWDVFISHAGRDADKRFALQLWDLLDKPGIGLRTFLDERSLRIGEDAGPQMTEAMKSSRVGLLLLSREFFQRDSTKEELGFLLKRAALQRIKLLPVFLRMTTEECAAELEAAFPGWLCGRSLPNDGCLQAQFVGNLPFIIMRDVVRALARTGCGEADHELQLHVSRKHCVSDWRIPGGTEAQVMHARPPALFKVFVVC